MEYEYDQETDTLIIKISDEKPSIVNKQIP